MKAMLLAAGLGTRLRPLTDRAPKPMIPIAGRPLLEHTVEHLARQGIRDLVINLCYRPEAIKEYFGDGRRWGVRIHYSLEPQPLGTAGAIKKVQQFLADGPFLVWYGDNLSRCDVRRMYQVHRARRAALTLALHYREDPTSSGIVGLDTDERILRFLEKPRPDQIFSRWVSAGIMIVQPSVFHIIPANTVADLGRDVFPALLARGVRLFGYRLSPSEGLWWIDSPADLERVQTAWKQGGIGNDSLQGADAHLPGGWRH